MASGDQNEIENELGDVLFTVVNIARHLKVDSEAALRKANRRFEARIRSAERMRQLRGRPLWKNPLSVLTSVGKKPS